jgi:hypothetical protein
VRRPSTEVPLPEQVHPVDGDPAVGDPDEEEEV